MKPTRMLPSLLLALLAITPLAYGADAPTAAEQAPKPVSEIKWVEPFDMAKQEAKQTGKPMLVFIGNTDSCKDCQAFMNSVCTSRELIDYAATNLICTRLLYGRSESKDEDLKSSQIIDGLNMHGSHAVVIANVDGKRIGELSTTQPSIGAFFADIKTIIAKAPPEGRLKYSEVSMFDEKFVPEKTYNTPLPVFSKEPLKGRYINFMTTVNLHFWENTRARLHGMCSDEAIRKQLQECNEAA